jgi:hypothetical protein
MNKATLLLSIALLPVFVYGQNRYDIVIDELMIDPTPVIGLPANEWIELKNTSTIPVNLQNWRIADPTGQSGPMPNFILQPDSFVIVCPLSALASMSAFGTCIGITGFPSLDNDADELFLKTPVGMTMHAVSYTSQWYRNELKKEGGWTLEMTDTRNPCSGSSNWKASTSPAGGTPGSKNSVDAINADNTSPRLLHAYPTDSVTIILVFNEPVDSLSGATTSNYHIDGGLFINSAMAVSPSFNKIQLKTNSLLQPGKIYTITVDHVTDCKNNSIGSDNAAKTGLPADARPGDWIINEILFNPRSSAYDYVEFYNNSDKIFDASKLYIANRNSSGTISAIKPLSNTAFFIFPGDYLVITEDASNLMLHYHVQYPHYVVAVPSLPSFPDDAGHVIALNFQGVITDEVSYNKNWHFKLITNDEGVALERIDPARSSQDPVNWHSAASTAGYGTPTYKNSQYKQPGNAIGSIQVSPAVFSPDNDGHNDIATIQYKMDGPGYMTNVTVFDAAGRMVRHLVRNSLPGLSGYWNWDGLDDKGNKLSTGIYIIFIEIFNLQGKKDIFRNTIVLTRKL